MRVLSIPAGSSFELIEEYLIHAFPHLRSYDYSGLVTFRKKGGFMGALYNVEKAITIDFDDKEWNEGTNYLDENVKIRIMGYIEERKKNMGFKKPEYMFWILKIDEILLHEPRPIQNYSNHVYFNYDELSSGEKIVEIASRKIGKGE